LPTPSCVTDNPLPFESLKFNPLGLFDLRRRLGVLSSSRGTFTRHQARFLASDIAWFAAGCHNDSNHTVPSGEFHPFFKTAREGASYEERTAMRKKVLDLLFDMATLSDRSFGRCTMILHVDGTLIPNAPPLLEYIKSDVYLPLPFINEGIVSPSSVAKIVQDFIEEIAVPAVIQWKNAGAITPGLNWKFTDAEHHSTPSSNSPNLLLIPTPTSPMSSRRVFLGRAFGSLNDDLSSTLNPSTPPSSLMSCEDIGAEQAMADLWEEVEQLRAVLSLAKNEEQASQELIASLRNEIKHLSTCLTMTMSELGIAQSGVRLPSPPPFTEENISHVLRSSSPSKALRRGTPTPVSPSHSRPRAVPNPGNIFQLSANPEASGSPHPITAASPARRHSPIKSFGPESIKVIAHHSLSHRVHMTLHNLCDEFTIEAWPAKLLKLFPQNVVTDLVAAMHIDVGVLVDLVNGRYL